MSDTHIDIATGIVAAYVSHNTVRADEFKTLLSDVYARIVDLVEGASAEPIPAKPTPLMPWKKTIHNNYLISLEDGKQYKTLKRHLSRQGMTPDEYRVKWGLPSDYPIVCKAYSARRSELAQAIGLGRVKPEPETVSEPKVEAKTAPKKKAEPKAEKKVTPILKPKDRAKPPIRAKDTAPALEGSEMHEEAQDAA